MIEATLANHRGKFETTIVVERCLKMLVFCRFQRKEDREKNVLWNCCRRFSCRNCHRSRPGVEWRGWTLDYHRVYLCLLARRSCSGDTDLPWIFHPLIRHRVPFSISRRIYQLVWVSSLRFSSPLLAEPSNFVRWKKRVRVYRRWSLTLVIVINHRTTVISYRLLFPATYFPTTSNINYSYIVATIHELEYEYVDTSVFEYLNTHELETFNVRVRGHWNA